MDKKFFLRFLAFFLTVFVVNPNDQAALVAMEKSKEEDSLSDLPPKLLHLNRVDEDNDILLKYTDNLKLASSDFVYNLNFPIDDELTRKVLEYGNQDQNRNHMLVNSFDIFQKNKETFIEYEPLTTKIFHEVGIGAKNTDIPIDWGSKEANLSSTNKIAHRNSIGIYNGHSEPQFIRDIKDLFDKNSAAVVKLFIPRPNKLKDAKLHMCGLELYSYHDICDGCLAQVVQFRKDHQKGQKSISQAIKAKLKDQYLDEDNNNFTLIYHTIQPYKGSHNSPCTYHTQNDEQHHTIEWSPEKVNKKNGGKLQSCDAFWVKDGEENISALQKTALIQANQVDTTQNVIYGQIHSLYNKKGTYQKPATNNRYQFIFDGQSK